MPRKLGSPGFVAFPEILREMPAGVSSPQTPTVAEGVILSRPGEEALHSPREDGTDRSVTWDEEAS